jgi:hypothetical protein
LAPVNGSSRSRGLLAHSALALTPEGLPLGVLSLDGWGEAPPGLPAPGARASEDRESEQGLDALADVSAVLPASTRGIVIGDRESDV